jgi:hypothetical protein
VKQIGLFQQILGAVSLPGQVVVTFMPATEVFSCDITVSEISRTAVQPADHRRVSISRSLSSLVVLYSIVGPDIPNGSLNPTHCRCHRNRWCGRIGRSSKFVLSATMLQMFLSVKPPGLNCILRRLNTVRFVRCVLQFNPSNLLHSDHSTVYRHHDRNPDRRGRKLSPSASRPPRRARVLERVRDPWMRFFT